MKHWLILLAFMTATPAFGITLGHGHLGVDRLGDGCGPKLEPYEWREHVEEIEQQLRSAHDSQIKVILPIHEFLHSTGRTAKEYHHVFYVEFENGLKAVWKTKARFAEEAAF